jgi:hypothetical protein
MIYKILVVTHMFSVLYMVFTWLAEAETCSEKTCVIYSRKKLVANEAIVFYRVLFVIHTQQDALTHNYERSRVWFPMSLLDFTIILIIPTARES